MHVSVTVDLSFWLASLPFCVQKLIIGEEVNRLSRRCDELNPSRVRQCLDDDMREALPVGCVRV